MTKHPNPLLSAFGGALNSMKLVRSRDLIIADPIDPEQDFFDILVIPLATYLTYPLEFHEWWIVTVYILYIEAAGHSGARIYWTTPITGPILKWFDMELILEDQ